MVAGTLATDPTVTLLQNITTCCALRSIKQPIKLNTFALCAAVTDIYKFTSGLGRYLLAVKCVEFCTAQI